MNRAKHHNSLRSIPLLLLVLLALLVSTSHAKVSADEFSADNILKILDQAEAILEQENPEIDVLEEQLEDLPEYRKWAIDCIQTRDSIQDNLNENLKSLGEAREGEAEILTRERESITDRRINNERARANCKLILLRSEEILRKITHIKKNYLIDQFTMRGPGFLNVLRQYWQDSDSIDAAEIKLNKQNTGIDLISSTQYGILLILIILAILIALQIRRKLTPWVQSHQPGTKHSSQLACAIIDTFIFYAPYLFASIVAAIYIYSLIHHIQPLPFLAIFSYGLPIVVILLAIIHLFLHQSTVFRTYTPKQQGVARRLSRRLKLLVLLFYIGYLLFATMIAQSLSESALLLSRGIFGFILILTLLSVIQLLARFRKPRRHFIFYSLITLLLIASLITEFFGYRYLSLYILRTTLGTLMIIGLYKLINLLLTEFIDAIESGQSGWQRTLHRKVGIQPGSSLPGMIWVRLLVTILMWSLSIIALLYIWQVPDTYTQGVAAYFSSGLDIGPVTIYPDKIVLAVLFLPVLLTINAWFKKRLEHQWLEKSLMERGAKESIATIIGYVGISITILVALSIAGMDFSKLALIAGALSVGIGFGLQNIVNNFVSGLILLFERPIKIGDWIEVGSVVGHVKKISIRSTQIQTFDKADIIVPNSDLISGTVTNWMLWNNRGRIRVPVSVAYGTNTDTVKELLLSIAKENKEVISDSPLEDDPDVIFMGFGDSSLDFQLRCYIYNIDKRLTTLSALNFAIDRTFRENNIEIPFPQRDVHIRDVPEKNNDKTDLPHYPDDN